MDQAGGGDALGLPWASLLDPVANARALSEVQALGLRAAGELVERFVRSVDGDPPPAQPAGGAESDGEESAAGGPAGRFLEAWTEFLRRTADSIGRVADPGRGAQTPPSSVQIDVTTGASSRGVAVVVDCDGVAVTSPAEVWLHNGTGTSVGPLALRCGDLQTAEGCVVAGTLVFDPAEIDQLPPRSSRGFEMHVAPSAVLVPGTYRGLLQVVGAPEVWLLIEVVVQDQPR